MKSRRTVDGVAKSHQKDIALHHKGTASQDGDADDPVIGTSNETSENSRLFAQTVNEKIVAGSNAILKGVRITGQQVTGDQAVVMIEVSEQSIAAAKNIQQRMSAAMY